MDELGGFQDVYIQIQVLVFDYILEQDGAAANIGGERRHADANAFGIGLAFGG